MLDTTGGGSVRFNPNVSDLSAYSGHAFWSCVNLAMLLLVRSYTPTARFVCHYWVHGEVDPVQRNGIQIQRCFKSLFRFKV